MKGWRQLQLLSKDERRPIQFNTLTELLGALPQVCQTPEETALFRAAFAVAFFGAYRISEIIAPSGSIPGTACVRREDVDLRERHMDILLRRSKTDQAAKGKWTRIRCIERVLAFPVCLLQAHLNGQKQTLGPLFRHKNGSFLSQFQFMAVLRLTLIKIGLPAREYGSHSFRIGAATTAAGLGLKEGRIKGIGRLAHTSVTYAPR